MQQNHRLLELDALRGIAAFAVAIYHYFYRYDQIYGHENIPVNWAYFGQLGVELFFMISGFVIFWTLNRTEKPFDFIISRFSRLYPTYWAAILTTFIVLILFGLPGREVSYTNAVLNILMFQEYLRIPHIDGVYWTLTVELTFYFWMFTLYLTNKLDKAEHIFSILVLISILHSLEYISIPVPLYKVFLLEYLPFFLAGICFYKISHGRQKISTISALFISLVSTTFIYPLEFFIIFTIFYLIFYLSISGFLKKLTLKPLIFMGGISYSFYLLHQNIGYVVINEFYKYNWCPSLGILSAIILCIFLAFLLSKYIEGPAISYIRQCYRERKKHMQEEISK